MGNNTFSATDGKGNLAVSAWAAVAGLTLLHVLLAYWTELIPEEAYYWTYSQHPALSYFDHPPMVAWIIWLGTALFGDNEFGVRSIAIALWPGSAWLLWQTGRLWFNAKTADVAVLLFCLTPIFTAVGFIVTPDAPLLFFWLLTLYACSRALHSGQGVYWLLAGFGLGCAMLSKYTAVMLAASLLLFLLLSDRHRHWLRRVEPWLGLLLALAVFSPVVIWNVQHHWASFLFQSSRTATVGHNPVHEASQFWLYQLLALTPLLLALHLYTLRPAIRRGWLQREDAWNFAMSFALPLFAVFVLASFKNKGHVNWTAPTYLSWSLASAALAVEFQTAWQTHRPLLWRALAGCCAAVSLSAIALGHASLAFGMPAGLSMSNAGGWRAFAAEIGKARAELGENAGRPTFVIGGDKLNISASVGFYLHDTANTVNDYAIGAPGIGYRYWTDLAQFAGRPAVVVLPRMEQYSIALLKVYFAQVGEPVWVEAQGQGRQRHGAYVIRCLGYAPRPEQQK
ncbi:MAG: glycosyltransferase family 39 protein [Candidatus Methylumidiphilus sp.]